MNRLLAGLGMMLWAGSLLASEKNGDTTSAAAPLQHSEAVAFSQQLDGAIHIVAENYVRPISRSKLLLAALTGLFETARKPVPRSLTADIQNAKDDQQRLDLIARTRESLGDLPTLQGGKALEISARAMCRLLDPYSEVVSLKEAIRSREVGPHLSYGLQCEEDYAGPVKIKSVLPGGPAQRAGLRPGDRITHIDGKAATATIFDYKETVQSPAPDPPRVELTTLRPGSKDVRKVLLQLEDFRPESVFGIIRQDDNTWDFMLDREHQIAQVRIGSLADGTSEELQQALSALKDMGVRGLILDLRWCPGGFFKESVAVARLFLDEVPIAKIKSRDGQDQQYMGKRDVNFLDFPVIVLVNHETMGGAELIAAALQDNKRAFVAGQRTFGKASIQILKALGPPDLGLKLSTGTFLRPSGKNLHRFHDSKLTAEWGILPEPTLEFRVSPDLSKKLREWWLWQTLRPGTSREVLPLDDPTADPQRQVALKALLEILDNSANRTKQSVRR